MCKSCEAVKIFVKNVTEFPSGSDKTFEIKGLVFKYDAKLNIVRIPEAAQGKYDWFNADIFNAVKAAENKTEEAKEIDKIVKDLLPDEFDEMPDVIKFVAIIKIAELAKKLYAKGHRAPEQKEG